nr:MAG TPA: hypothetical protein [Caudoviricetes sp.]
MRQEGKKNRRYSLSCQYDAATIFIYFQFIKP